MKAPSRLIAIAITMFVAAGCVTTYSEPTKEDPEKYERAAKFLEEEIQTRIYNLQYQADAELYQNMKRLAYIGEPAIPFLLAGLDHKSPRTRGSIAFILGLIRDRRTIPDLVDHLDDEVAPVRYEIATTICVMGDNAGYPALIAGLKDDDIRNRYKAHEALLLLTQLDFGFEYDGEPDQRDVAVGKWQSWFDTLVDRGY
ncbi:MAG: HEAT repeat domain-containing protein [Planctomycetota bacterium]